MVLELKFMMFDGINFKVNVQSFLELMAFCTHEWCLLDSCNKHAISSNFLFGGPCCSRTLVQGNLKEEGSVMPAILPSRMEVSCTSKPTKQFH